MAKLAVHLVSLLVIGWLCWRLEVDLEDCFMFKVFSTVYPGHNTSDVEIMNNEIIFTVNRYSSRYILENYVDDLQHTQIPIADLLDDNHRVKSEFTVSNCKHTLLWHVERSG